MDDRVQEGMNVYSADGQKLGRVVQRGETQFLIEKGFFFPKDYLAAYSDIRSADAGDLILSRDASELGDGSSGSIQTESAGAENTGYENLEGETRPSESAGASLTEETRVPLVEEELSVEKRTRQAGAVRVRKEVVTEQKQVTVPVTKEVVRVERVPVSETSGAGASADSAFDEQDVVVPLREEEVEIRKRPVVKEEVRISKSSRQEQRTASASVRKEVADIDDTTEKIDDEPTRIFEDEDRPVL